MIRLLLVTVTVFAMATPAEAEEHNVPPSATLFQLKPTDFNRQTPRDKAIQFQIQLRQEESQKRSWDRFEQPSRSSFLTPAERSLEERRNKFRVGVVIRF